jgi:hypothetical protein
MSIETRLNELRELAKTYAKAQSQRVYLEEFKKSRLAQLMKRYESQYPTAAAQEREARADPQYIELLDGLRVATEEAERARWELKIAEWGVDLWRTKQANDRAERRGYGA